jgi:hypothetical protein
MPLYRRFLIALPTVCLCVSPLLAQGSAANSCDLNADGIVNKSDADLAVSMSLGQIPCTANIAGPGVCNAVVVQRVADAAQAGGACLLSGGSHAVQLTWVASTSPNVVGYNVYRSSVTGGPYTLVTSTKVSGTSYLDTTVGAGTTYFYVVSAVDSNGVSSPYSNQATAIVPTP